MASRWLFRLRDLPVTVPLVGRQLRPAARSTSGVVSLDPATGRHDRAGGESNDPANDSGRKAKLDSGKRCSGCIDAKANDQPNDRPDQSY